MPPMTINIKLGETGAQFLQRNHLPAKGHINKQPAGVNFYEHDWKTRAPGTVMVEHGIFSFQIPYALGVMGAEDVERMASGLEYFSISAGITSADTILHNNARQEFIALLQKLLHLGWKPLFSYNYPRLTGEQAFQYYQEDDNYGIPPDYIPSLDEWMQIKSGYWRLYAKNVFLKINFQRDRTRMDPNKPGAYLFSFGLRTQEEYARSNFFGEERAQWQDLWVEKIKTMKKERYSKESILIKRGFTIYTEYDEPEIHPADPVEP